MVEFRKEKGIVPKAMSTKSGLGKITVSDEALTTCIAEVATDVDGVREMFTGITGNITKSLLKKDLDPSKGVKIAERNGKLYIDIFIIVEYKAKIPVIAWELQTEIIKKVEDITDMDVEEVNIHVKGVSI